MNTFHNSQHRFKDYVLRGEGKELAAQGIKCNGLTALEGVALYRNNTQLGLTEALRDGYPVVNKLVVTEFFNLLAHSYIRRYPPRQAVCCSTEADLPSLFRITSLQTDCLTCPT